MRKNRVNTYPITKEAKKKGISIIYNILRNNKYDNKTLNTTHHKPQKDNANIQQLKEKWATFTYHGKQTRKLTQLFRDTYIKIAFKTKNTIQNILKPYTQTDKYEKNGVYQMKCMSCPMKYIGQTGRPFNTRHKEHIRDIKNNNTKSGYSNHILNTGHSCGSITNTMEIMKIERKGKHLNTLEKYHIYKISKEGIHMNGIHDETYNQIFEVINNIDTRRHHTQYKT
jgi:hypothetical protein